MKLPPWPAKRGHRTRLVLVPVLLCGLLSYGGCDDDDLSGASGRDTRLEWPVDSGGFSTPDGGSRETRAHDSDTHQHDATDAHDGQGDGHDDVAAEAHPVDGEPGDADRDGEDDAAGLGSALD
jgi:hypothetical protein